MSNVVTALPLPHVYYEHAAKNYWVEDTRRRWIRLNEDSIRNFLNQRGYSKKCAPNAHVSAADESLLRIQLEQNVDYAGGLAGHIAGYYEFNGCRVLVTESPRLITPVSGDWPLISRVLTGLLVDGDIDQRPYFYGWIKQAMLAYRQHRWAPGQVLALAGPREAGKSLLQGLLTEIFGGRSADAHNYVAGRTMFNAEMFRSEHLIIEDKNASTTIIARIELGARIKEFTANRVQHCHGKHKDGLQLGPIWRMSISLNNEPERMMVLPPIDPDLEDKIILLKANHAPMPMPTASADEKEAFMAALKRELPAFLHFVENREIPESERSARYGVTHYHHPELLAMLNQTAPEFRLLTLIDMELWHPVGVAVDRDPIPREWEGSAVSLEQRLTRDNSSVRHEARKLLTYHTACGTYLSRLQNKPAARDRVGSRMVRGERRWTIRAPVREQPDGLPG
jgi:hypothetical protein